MVPPCSLYARKRNANSCTEAAGIVLTSICKNPKTDERAGKFASVQLAQSLKHRGALAQLFCLFGKIVRDANNIAQKIAQAKYRD